MLLQCLLIFTVVLSTDPGNGTDTQEFHLNLKVGRYSNLGIATHIKIMGEPLLVFTGL
jgi:hypothetical protein